jgi:hypothetical protein
MCNCFPQMTTEMNDDMANDSTSDRADGEFVPWGPPMVPTTAGHARDTVDAVCKFNNRKPGAPRPVGHAHNTVDAVCKFNNRKPGAPRPVGHTHNMVDAVFKFHNKQPSAPGVSESGQRKRKRP